MSLLAKLQERNKASNFQPRESEIVGVIIKSITGTRSEDRVRVITDQGTFFIWKSAFPKGLVPSMAGELPAQLVLEENKTEQGEFVNVIAVNYNAEALGKYNTVATFGNAVAL